jgi:hypothetical protein
MLAVLFALVGMYAQATPPATATVETWKVSYTFTSGGESESAIEDMEVAFDGNAVYFNFPNPITGATWMQGTIDGQTAVFAKGQEIGTYMGIKCYYMGQNTEGLCDIVFNYNQENSIFTLGDLWLVINGSLTQSYALGYFSSVTVSKKNDKPDVVTPPEGLRTGEYEFSATNIYQGVEGMVMEPIKYNVRMGVSNNVVYIQGLCHSLPDAWVKGSRSVDGSGEFTLASGQYYGELAVSQTFGYEFYFAAASYPTTNPIWLDNTTFSYDQANVRYTAHDLLTLNSSATQLAPYELYAGACLTKITDKAANPAEPSVALYMPYNDDPKAGYGYMYLDIPTLSDTGESILSDKLSYQLYYEKDGEQAPYTFRKDIYKEISEDMSEVPYNYSDGFDIYRGGSRIYFYDDIKDVDKVGVKSIYNGGGERHESAIAWYDVKASAGIKQTVNSLSAPVSVTYTDLQGRAVGPDFKGLVLKTTRMSDGTVKTVKTLH